MKTHEGPYCLACGSDRIATEFTSSLNGREINETLTLKNSVDSMSRFLRKAIGRDEEESDEGFDAIDIRCIASDIDALCAMWIARLRPGQDNSQPEAQS